MSESFEQLLNESYKTIHTGEVVKGTVIAVKENEINVNIGYKHDGVIQKNELENEVNVGDEIEAKVIRLNDGDGLVQLSTKRMRTDRVSQVLQDAFDNHTELTATVDEVVKGGLSVTVDGVKVFIPASLVSDIYENDLSKYAGQEITFVLTEYNPRRHRVIGNRKQLIVAEKAAALEALLERVHVGDTVEGTVKSVTEYGAFIDIGGADGLLHVSEMAWGRTPNPRRLFKPGDTVKVFVKSIEGSKIGLSKKFPEDNPWADAETRFAEGNIVDGKVVRLTDFGAFVELADHVDGLLHVSQIQRERVEKPSDVLQIGQVVTVKITGLDLENRKISLSMKALLPKPERKPRQDRNNRRQRREDYADEVAVDIDAYIAKMAREEAEAEAKAAEAAKDAAAEAADAVAEAVTETVDTAAEAVAEAAENAAENVAEAAVEAVEAAAEAAGDAE